MRTAPHRPLFAAAATLAAALSLGGCPEPRVASAPPIMVVVNSLDRAITSLDSRDCGGDATAWRPIEGSYVQPGHTYSIPTSRFPGCIDLRARDEQGQVVGAQQQLRLVAGSRWEIQ